MKKYLSIVLLLALASGQVYTSELEWKFEYNEIRYSETLASLGQKLEADDQEPLISFFSAYGEHMESRGRAGKLTEGSASLQIWVKENVDDPALRNKLLRLGRIKRFSFY